MARLKLTRFLVQLFIFIGVTTIVFRAFIASDGDEKENDNDVGNLKKSKKQQARKDDVDGDSAVEERLAIFKESNQSLVKKVETVEDTADDLPNLAMFRPSASEEKRRREEQATCRRKIIPKLWSKQGGSSNGTFPTCTNLLRAVLMKKKDMSRRLAGELANWTITDPHDVRSITAMMQDCPKFRREADFADKPASSEEAEYPLAYVFLPYKNMPQAVRLFRMIYQPQNVYCITYDTKADEETKRSIVALAACFPSNVYVNPNLEPIYYSTFSLLHSVMQCMDILRQSPIKWRYVQITSWNDFPLKTNWEMVRIFKALNGSQDCELNENKPAYFVAYEHGIKDKVFSRGTVPRPIPPAGVTMYKGSFATTMSWEFVQFMFTDPVSIQLYNYFNGSQFPDESYWPTLIHNIHLNPPGGFPGQCLVFHKAAFVKKPWISRFQLWRWTKEVKCRGHWERKNFCIFGIGDLETLIRRVELFAHKLYEEYQPALLYCLEEWFWAATCMGKDTGLNAEYYQQLPSVRYRNLPKEAKENFVCMAQKFA